MLVSETDLPKIQSLKTAEVIRPKSGSSATAMETTDSREVKTEEFDVGGLRVLLRAIRRAKSSRREPCSRARSPTPERSGPVELLILKSLKSRPELPKEKMARDLTRPGHS